MSIKKKQKVVIGLLVGALAITGVSTSIVLNKKANASSSKNALYDEAKVYEEANYDDGTIKGVPVEEYRSQYINRDNKGIGYDSLIEISSEEHDYSEVKGKDVIIVYELSDDEEKWEKMDMEVLETEEDGTTPKKVKFNIKVPATIPECSSLKYRIVMIPEGVVSICPADIDIEPLEETKRTYHVFDDIESIDNVSDAGENPKNMIVHFATTREDDGESPEDVDSSKFMTLTYTINGENPKTVYAYSRYRGIIELRTFECDIFANEGDVIEFTYTMPMKDKSLRTEKTVKVVVKK